jgi:hypothetical protein
VTTAESAARASKDAGPTVVLIGGPMTVEDGSALDSRQPVAGDPQCRITRTCLGGSMRWWLTVISLVQPLLRAAGDDAFCLVIGGRTLMELEADGSVRRTGLRSVLPGGLSRVEIVRTGIDESLDPVYEPVGEMDPSWNGSSMGEIGLLHSEPRLPWRVLDGNEWYLKQAGPTLRPAVIIDTTDSALLDPSFESLSARRLFDEQITLVLPHTLSAERYIRAYAGATDPAQSAPPKTPPPVPWDPQAPRDPVHYTKLVPIEASFGVTGLTQGRAWLDPSDLEAARTLLEARFDLQIGIWDLVGNPTLRRALLDAVPVPPPPVETAPIPITAAERAAAQVDEKSTEAVAAEQALRSIAKHLAPMLSLGWKAEQSVRFLQLPLTEAVSRWGGEAAPLVQLEFTITKRQCSVAAFTPMYNQVKIGEYVEARRTQLERIASPDECPLGTNARTVLWRASGGWGDDIDWSERAAEIAQRTTVWISAFEDFCAEARRIHHETQGVAAKPPN